MVSVQEMISESLVVFTDHTWQLSSASFNTSSTLLATTSWDRSIIIYNINELKPKYIIKDAHSLPITCVQWMDTYILTTSADKTISLWDSTCGKSIRKFSGHSGWVMSCEVEGSKFVTSSWDNTLAIWDIDHPQPVSVLSGHMAGVWSCSILKNSKVVASASEDCTIRLWDQDSGNSFATMAGGHNDAITTICWPANEFILASSSVDSKIILWDTRTCKVLTKIDTNTDAPIKQVTKLLHNQIASIGGPYLKTWSIDDSVRVHETGCRKFLNDLECIGISKESVLHVIGDVSAKSFLSLFTGIDETYHNNIKIKLSTVLESQKEESDRLASIPVIRDEGNRSPRGNSSSCSDSGVDIGVSF